MSVIGSNILAGASGPSGYDIDYSIRCDGGDDAHATNGSTAYLVRGPISNGTGDSQRIFTLSCWIKLGANIEYGSDQISAPVRTIYAWSDGNGMSNVGLGPADASGNDYICLKINSLDSGGSYYYNWASTPFLRDQSSWYHLVVAMDTTQGDLQNRIRAWLNNDQITTWGTQANSRPTQNQDVYINGAGHVHQTNYISGALRTVNSTIYNHWDGGIAELHALDGIVKTPSDFGELDPLTNKWKAKKYSGTYGTTGIYLDFANSAALGADSSGNGNNFTVNGFTASDQIISSPQNSTGSNFATIHGHDSQTSSKIYEGDLKIVTVASGYSNNRSTFFCPAGTKWYWEFVPTTGYNYAAVGITTNSHEYTINPGGGNSTPSGHGVGFYNNEVDVDGSRGSASGASAWASGDIVGLAYDVDDRSLRWYINNSLNYTYTTVPVSSDGDYSPSFGDFGGSVAATINVNFGADSSFAGTKTAQGNSDANDCGDFYYTPPSGYLALCSDNLPDPSIPLPEENFKTIKWTGSDGSRDHTGVGFSPAFVYIKNSSGAAGYSHQWFDTLRGVGKTLRADTSAAELTNNHEGYLDSFDADGFSTLAGSTDNSWTNRSSHVYHAWNWRIPTAFSGATAGSGTLKTYTGIKNPDAGMSIVGYTGNGTNGHFIPHGLGKAPEMTIIRLLDNASGTATAEQWEVIGYNYFSSVYHTVKLDVSPAQSAQGAGGVINAAPDATHVKLGLNGNTNGNNITFNMWNFTNIEGYQKIGSFVGNSSIDGKFVYLGFKPSLLWLAPITNVTDGNWNFVSDGENGVTNYNVISNTLLIDTSSNQNADNVLDLLSNGFKMRKSSAYWNHTSTTIFYLAIAERPFKYGQAR